MDRPEKLQRVVAQEAMLWGNDVADSYHGRAARDMDRHWDTLLQPFLRQHAPDLSTTMELACGYGRNSRKLLEAGAHKLTLVDVNADNIEYCREHIAPLGDVTLVQNNGIDLAPLSNEAFTFVYTFDSMVHFDLQLVMSYVQEFSRVLKPGGTALIHHSNYTASPESDFRQNPHWRNFMSAEIMRYLARRNALEVVEQRLIPWGGIPDLDCLSLLRRRPLSSQTSPSGTLQKPKSATGLFGSDYHPATLYRNWLQARRISKLLASHNADFSAVLEVADGFQPSKLQLKRLQPMRNIAITLSKDMASLPSGTFTFAFGTMVHLDLESIRSRITEWSRVLKPGATAMIQHSNYTASPEAEGDQNPQGRGFMSAAIMRYLAPRNSFEVVEQALLPWGNVSDLDCLSTLRRLPD